MVAMVVTLVGSMSIPVLWTKNPRNFLADTPKAHFSRFILNLKILHLSNTFQPKRHYSVVEIIYGHSKGSFLHIFWCHSNLVVPTESIHEGKHGIPYYTVYQQVHVG